MSDEKQEITFGELILNSNILLLIMILCYKFTKEILKHLN
jgi:hypothetical protein